MPQSIVRVLLHIVFSTKNRANLIRPEFEDGLFAYINGIVEKNNTKLIAVNGTEDHIHLLVSTGKVIDIPELVGDVKRDTSKWVKTKSVTNDFYWQRGYAAFSIGRSQVAAVVSYINNQKDRHRTEGFQDEYRELLSKYEVEFDERYVWD